MPALLGMKHGDNCRPIGPELAPWSQGLMALLRRADEVPTLPLSGTASPAKFPPQSSPPLALPPDSFPDERCELWRTFLQNRTNCAGIHARNALLESYWPLVKSVVYGLCRRLEITGRAGLGMGMESFRGQPLREDMRQEGGLGLIAALDGFDPRHGVNFGHFARLKIRGAVLDALRRWRRTDTRPPRASSIDTEPGHLVSAESLPERARRHQSFDRIEFDDAVEALTMGLDPRRQAVARLWLEQQMSMAQIAAVLKIHISRVGQIRRGLVAQWRADPRWRAMLR